MNQVSVSQRLVAIDKGRQRNSVEDALLFYSFCSIQQLLNYSVGGPYLLAISTFKARSESPNVSNCLEEITIKLMVSFR